jgi:hypothetical protein
MAAARQWLLGGRRRLERRERDRRFATSIGGTTVVGELARVWISTDDAGERRVLVGAALAVDPLAGSDGASERPGSRGVHARTKAILRRLAAGALMLDHAGASATSAPIAILWQGPRRRILDLPA